MPDEDPAEDHGVLPWALSGRSPEALRAQAEQLRSHLMARTELGTLDVAYSLVATRSALEHRAVVTARTVRNCCAGSRPSRPVRLPRE
ncbi:hypothetical protein GCM10017744_011110 [Streptomyces antimycoticus]